MKSSPIRVVLTTLSAAFLLALPSLEAQISYATKGDVHREDFDALVASGEGEWEDGKTLEGWSALFSRTGTPERYVAFDGTTSVAGLRSFGTRGSRDRALGLAPGSEFGSVMVGIALRNDTGESLQKASISYQGQLWRGVGKGDKALIVSYQIGEPEKLSEGEWHEIEELRFSAPEGESGEAYDGTSALNSATLTATLSDLNWNAGEVLSIRFFQNNDPQNKHFAIDEFSFSATP